MIASMNRWNGMRILRRVLLVTTPLGVAIGLYEAWQLAGGLVVLMAAQMIVLGLHRRRAGPCRAARIGRTGGKAQEKQS